MSRSDTEGRRASTVFDEVPVLYDRYRPHYPEPAVDTLVGLTHLMPGGRVLEVGAGTGQLTLPLAMRGFQVTALEPGHRMAELLARKLHGLPTSRVLTTRLEDAPVEPASFDVVVSATAFHWVDPSRRYRLAAAALRRGGALALMRNDHVAAPSSAAYYEGVQPIYERHAPELASRYRLSTESDLRGLAGEMAASHGFRVVAERRFAWDQRYSAAQLIGLLRTYSDHRSLPPRRRAKLLAAIRTFVDARLGGSFIDRYVTTLCVGKRR